MDDLRYKVILDKAWSLMRGCYNDNIPVRKVFLSPGDYRFMIYYYVNHSVSGVHISEKGDVYLFGKPVEVKEGIEDGSPDVDADVRGLNWIG